MYMRKILFYLFLLTVTSIQANPVDDILERIDKGASRKFQTILVKSDKDFFEIDQKSHPSSNSRKTSSPIIIRGNSWVNIAVECQLVSQTLCRHPYLLEQYDG